MRILSFDVGIKNLAYCILELKETKEEYPYKIIQWGILDILSDIKKIPKCSIIQKNKKVCNRDSTIYENVNGTIIGYCNRHKKNCKADKYCYAGCSDIKKIPILDLTMLFIQKLDRHLEFRDVDIVVIENQPCLRNPRMKTVQNIIYMYFVMNGILNDLSKISDISLISARNKLSVYTGPKIECNLKNEYSRTKKLSIEYSKIILKDDEENKKVLMTHKKKDDLCDAFLQGAFFLKKYIK